MEILDNHQAIHKNGTSRLTNNDVCRMFHVNKRTLQDWRETGKIPFIRIKRKIQHQLPVVLNLFESRKI